MNEQQSLSLLKLGYKFLLRQNQTRLYADSFYEWVDDWIHCHRSDGSTMACPPNVLKDSYREGAHCYFEPTQ